MAWAMDDAKTQGYIDQALAENRMFRPLSTQLDMAWSSLYQKRVREDPNGDNRELAAAEHYMYARWQVCSGKTREELMWLLTIGYDPAKLLGYAPGILLIRKLAGHSWSYPSVDSVRWGLKGVSDGEADRKAQPQATP